MTQLENGQIDAASKAVMRIGVPSVIAGILLYLLFVSIRGVENKLDSHALKSEFIADHLDDEKRTHDTTISILRQMCVMQANTAQERRDCAK